MPHKTNLLGNLFIAVLALAWWFCPVDTRGAVITGGDKPVATQSAIGESQEVKRETTQRLPVKKKEPSAKGKKKKADTLTGSTEAPGPAGTDARALDTDKAAPQEKTSVPSVTIPAMETQAPGRPPSAQILKQSAPPVADAALPAQAPSPRPAVTRGQAPVTTAPQIPTAGGTAKAQGAPVQKTMSPAAPQPGSTAPKPATEAPALTTGRPTSMTKPTAASPGSPARVSPAMPPGLQHPAKETKYITIDFDNVDIQVFTRFISEMTGKNFIFDEKVRGKVTVLSPRKISTDEAYKVFESVLEVNGFAAIPAGDVTKIVPAQQAKEKQLETRTGFDKISPEDKMVTQIIPLSHASPDDMKKVLDPLIAKTSVIISYPPTGMLIVTDLLSNIKKLQEIVEAIDQAGVGEQITYVPLKHAVATDIAKALTAVFQQQKGIALRKFVADDRTNALIIMATENDTLRVKDLITMMDKGVSAGTLHVYRLQNASAEDLAKVLMNLPKTTTGAQQAAGTPVISKNVQIIADKATNTLVITADRADYAILESVIKQLDANRPMVYIEALIMEVSVTKNFRLGVEWQAMSDFTYNAKTGGVIGGVSGDSYSNMGRLLSPTAPALPIGGAIGVIGQGITVSMGGTSFTFPNFAALLQAYQGNSDISVLATPQLLTMNNEEAEINISKNVPYITRQDQTNTGTSATNYSNYEYKDVGIIVKITPNINEDGLIRLKIDQTVSSIDTTSDAYRPTTRKRSAKTTVMLRDGNTLVIGGLIQENTDVGTFKVPLLADIPILGWLFKYQRKTSDKTNLFFFISPKIVRTAAEAAALTTDKRSEIGVLEEGVIRMYDPKKDKPKAPKP